MPSDNSLYSKVKSKQFSKHNLHIDNHHLYFRHLKAKKENAKTVIIVHGGPGSTISDHHVRYFNREDWNIIQFDQRMCGKSTCDTDDFENMSVNDLSDDIQHICEHLQIDKVTLFATSWGATVALLAAAKFPNLVEEVKCVSPMVATEKCIRGIYTSTEDSQLYQMYQNTVGQYASLEELASKILDDHCPTAVLRQIQWEFKIGGHPVPESYDPKMLNRAKFAMYYFVRDDALKEKAFSDTMRGLSKHIPVSILKGSDDTSIPSTHMVEIQRVVPHAIINEIDGLSHSVLLDKRWNDLVVNFVA